MSGYCIKMNRKNIILFISAIIIIFTAYFLLWPINADPEKWNPPKAPKLCGIYEPNSYLTAVEMLGKGIASGPEDVAVDRKGWIYGGMSDGWILKFQPDGSNYEVFAHTGGRPLGLSFDADNNLIVADAYQGLLSISQDGIIRVLAVAADNQPFCFTDGVDIAKDGTIYFTDASGKYRYHEYMKCALEHKGNGRLIAYYPGSGSVKVLIENLYFANGVAVSPDQTFVLVCETLKYRIKRYWLRGPRQGSTDIFIENMPGIPDGISSNGKDTFWVALPSVRDSRFDTLLSMPYIRKIIMRLPDFVFPDIVAYSFVLGLNIEGKIIHNLQDPSCIYSIITSVRQVGDLLYIGSLSENSIGRIYVPEENINHL